MSAEMPSTEPDSSQSILALKAEETRVDTRDTQPGPSPNTELAGFSSAESTPTPVALDTDLSGAAYPRTAQQIAYAILRRSIMNGTLAPGTRLTQNQVAAQLSMSTTPVREALRRLASDELIRIDAHRGAIVRGLDRQELIDVYELRVLLEPLAMRKAVERISEQELDDAERFCDRMDDHSDVEAWSRSNQEFHAIFNRASGSPSLVRILQGLSDSAARYVQWSMTTRTGFSSAANREHRRLLAAFRNRDGERAATMVERHLRGTLAALLKSYGKSEKPDGADG